MPDNYLATQGVGTSFAADDVGGVLHPRVKPVWGADGVANDVSDATPLPVGGPAIVPTLYAVTLTVANTEYSQALPANVREIAFRCRTQVDVRYAFATGKVAAPTEPYHVLRAGAEYALDEFKAASLTLYFASATAGAVIELEAWA